MCYSCDTHGIARCCTPTQCAGTCNGACSYALAAEPACDGCGEPLTAWDNGASCADCVHDAEERADALREHPFGCECPEHCEA